MNEIFTVKQYSGAVEFLKANFQRTVMVEQRESDLYRMFFEKSDAEQMIDLELLNTLETKGLLSPKKKSKNGSGEYYLSKTLSNIFQF
ncbi:hypothetical protein [Persicobacter diffluens]|uniref:Uncharacterized protein n=1 Tax=Persicobacter diffluens TaxID=981 RepID=A0AAN5ALK2_9BACT|nr:hypothetical protein PEDI_34590 [Persicobacter diffluens]